MRNVLGCNFVSYQHRCVLQKCVAEEYRGQGTTQLCHSDISLCALCMCVTGVC